jgi:hypothetical protein
VPSVSSTGYSSTWIGLDGDSSKTVEQIGTEQDYINGKAVYYAWYEMYPQKPVELPLVIEPGDTIQAEVSYAKGAYTLTLDDLSRADDSSKITVESSKPIRSSAEWIEEATGKLADFTTVKFFDATATANGHQGPISDPAWQMDQITLVSKSGGTLAAPTTTTTTLSSDGSSSSFSINYEAKSNQVATLTKSEGAHAANMESLGDAVQHFSQLVGVADVHHDVGHWV